MKPKPMPPMRVGAKSECGKRSENQDCMSRFKSPFGEVIIVADGMGGHEGGALAAKMTCEGIEKYLRQIPPDLPIKEALQAAAQATNAEIYQRSTGGDPSTRKMGSTVVLAVVQAHQLWVGHAGDSRAYCFRHKKLEPLTRDHSPIQKMIDHGLISEEDAREHPDASVISRAFGQEPELELEVSPPILIQRGDGFMLCTDGLCGYVGDKIIEDTIEAYEDAQEITDTLISVALAAGGDDNITVQFLQFGARPKEYIPNLIKGLGFKSKEIPRQEAATIRGAIKTEIQKEGKASQRTTLLYFIIFSLGMILGAVLLSAAPAIVQKVQGFFSFFVPNMTSPNLSGSPSPLPSRSREPEVERKPQGTHSGKQIDEIDQPPVTLRSDSSRTPSPGVTSPPANRPPVGLGHQEKTPANEGARIVPPIPTLVPKLKMEGEQYPIQPGGKDPKQQNDTPTAPLVSKTNQISSETKHAKEDQKTGKQKTPRNRK